MNDNIVTCFVIEAALTCGIALSIVKVYRPGRPDVFMNVCTGVFHATDSLLEVKFPTDVVFALTCFVAYFSFYIPTFLQRFKIETSDQNQPKSTESLLLNFIVIGILVLVTLLTSLMNNRDMGKLGEYPFKIYPFISMFVPNLLIQGFMVVKVILKDGRHICREVYGINTPAPNPC